jgi:hypothetical protein
MAAESLYIVRQQERQRGQDVLEKVDQRIHQTWKEIGQTMNLLDYSKCALSSCTASKSLGKCKGRSIGRWLIASL